MRIPQFIQDVVVQQSRRLTLVDYSKLMQIVSFTALFLILVPQEKDMCSHLLAQQRYE